jgi:hypothetical protein
MGYTHYWTFNRAALSPEELATGFKLAAEEIKTLKRYLPKDLKICGGLGHGRAEITHDHIWFNGDGQTDSDHETFSIDLSAQEDEPALKRGFCKTARKPYDLLVCCALISLKRHLSSAFNFTSDGDREDWSSAIRYYNWNVGGNHAINHTAHL